MSIFKNLLPKKGIRSCGVEDNKNGSVVFINDVVQALEYCVDDDRETHNRVEILMDYLKNR